MSKAFFPKHYGVRIAGALAALIISSTSLLAAPDLIINRKDTRIKSGGCAVDEALASGWIAIKNIGEDTAKLKASEVVTLRSMLAVYVPENIDMISKIKEAEAMKPLDQEGLYFELGKGKMKKGRYFKALGSIGGTATVASNANATVYNTQRALLKLGFDPRGVDGVMGSRTRNAIQNYQKSRKMNATGRLTSSQLDQLYEEALIKNVTKSVAGARGKFDVVIYAVVDPYNLIEERNEANNIEKFTVTIDCGD